MMKKKMIIVIVAAVLLMAMIGSYVVYRVMARDVSFLPGEVPVIVKVAYFDERNDWQEVELSESEANAAIFLYQKLEVMPRYHSDQLVASPSSNGFLPHYVWYDKWVLENGGTVQFYFAQPLQYRHGDICACENYAYEDETYNHIDLICHENEILINFLLDNRVITTYNMSGSYLPSFRDILSAYNPAAVAE